MVPEFNFKVASSTVKALAEVAATTPVNPEPSPENPLAVIVPLALILPEAVTWLNWTLAVVATSCPMAISLALAVTPVPPTTFKVLLAAIVPPPVKPVPAITLTAEWSICSFATKLVVESWSICPDPLNAPLNIPVKELAVTAPLELISPEAVILPSATMWPFEPVTWRLPLNSIISPSAAPNFANLFRSDLIWNPPSLK